MTTTLEQDITTWRLCAEATERGETPWELAARVSDTLGPGPTNECDCSLGAVMEAVVLSTSGLTEARHALGW